MAWSIIKSGTVAQVNAAINALNATDQGTAANAQLVRAKAIMLAEVTAVGGTYVYVNCQGSMLTSGSDMTLNIQPIPFADSGGNFPTELQPNPNP